ncbi:MAG TPA: hypothetical protein VMC84_11585 [Methanocella sp.]|uniref:hypothetical protein n=1 Tax=Methanocella sp. TaxID=2052833 RepID=UPI002B74DE9F|nr:hypothetical protein [Methanocella sp.]HTY91809.1 hypothetical protein [Methanocella sp.]
MKEIVLGRLEQRLKEKDDEIHSLKKELNAGGDVKSLSEKVDHLESEVKETQIALSEVMKKVGALEGALSTMLMNLSNAAEEGYPEEDLSSPGVPPDDQPFDKFAANQKDIKEDGHNQSDATRFFHLSKNS